MRRLQSEVEQLYHRNRRAGHADWCDLDYDFVCPSAETYPFQWFWDSCFHAIVLSHFDLERARREISSLVSQAQPDGFIPHVIFWDRERHLDRLRAYNIAYRTPYLSDHIQPPVLADAIDAVVRRGGGDHRWLASVLPPAVAFFDWLWRVRDPDGDGLVAILQPDESGLDHSPKYDEYLGIAAGEETLQAFDAAWLRVATAYSAVGREPGDMFASAAFICEDVLVNSIYARNQALLARLLESTGAQADAERFRRSAARTRDALLGKCFDAGSGLFHDLAGAGERQLRVNTVSSLFPLIIDGIDSEVVSALVRHLESESEYATPFPVPSVAANEVAFSPATVGERLLWRGPVWLNANWYLVRGLRGHGCDALADRIAETSIELVRRAGFREYYDPYTGEGYGAPDFSWSALVLDMVD